MSLKIRPYDLGKDYPDLCEWWRARHWPAPPCHDLPTNGVIAEDAEHKYAAVFFYIVEGRWAWIDWLVTNPRAPLRPRPEAVELIVDSALKTIKAIKQAAGHDAYRVMTCLENENLIELFERHGFKKGDYDMTTLVLGGSFQ